MESDLEIPDVARLEGGIINIFTDANGQRFYI
jgi:hypothetical protein